MLHHPYISGPLLGIAVALCLLCALGLVVMSDAFQRMQFSAPVTSLAIFLITVAVWIEDSDWQAKIKSALIAVILFVMNAVLTHATARAIRLRREDHWPVTPDEHIPLMNGRGEAGLEPVLGLGDRGAASRGPASHGSASQQSASPWEGGAG